MSKKPPQNLNALAEALELVLEFGWVDDGSHFEHRYTCLRNHRQCSLAALQVGSNAQRNLSPRVVTEEASIS